MGRHRDLLYITQVMSTTKFIVVRTFSAMESASLGSDHWMSFIHHEFGSPQFLDDLNSFSILQII